MRVHTRGNGPERKSHFETSLMAPSSTSRRARRRQGSPKGTTPQQNGDWVSGFGGGFRVHS